MGLDQYLNVSQSESNWNFEVEQRGENDKYNKIIDAMGFDNKLDHHPSIRIEYTAIYWRKANQIHGWFINNLAGGIDQCQTIIVPREALVELQDICLRLLDAKGLDVEDLEELAIELLPPTQGFFFGTYEIDEWYWGDIQHTYDSLTELLEDIPADSWDHFITYRSSW